jgi:hypothetical protein
MGFWFVLGVLLAGCGIGALLTAVVYSTQLETVKTDLQTRSARAQIPPEHNLKGGRMTNLSHGV